MNRFSKTVLLMGTAALALSACSGTKGPGAIGTKDDIVVRNNGMPGAAKAPPPGSDIPESNVDASNAALAMPPAAVEQGEPLPDNSPAVEAAAQQVENATAPMPSSAAAPTADADPIATPEPATTPTTSQEIIPAEPVNETPAAVPPQVDAPAPVVSDAPAPAPVPAPMPAPVAAPVEQQPAPAPVTPAPAPQSSVYPAEDYPQGTSYIPPKGKSGNVANDLNTQQLQAIQGGASAVQPAPVAAPAPAPQPSANAYKPLPAGSDYPLDPNAPYSPSAVAKAGSQTPAPAVEPQPAQAPAPVAASAPATTAPTPAPVAAATGINLADPTIIRSAQAALKAKAGYAGAATGQIDAGFLNALTAYQSQNKLPVGGLNEATLRHLGVIE